jgi:hypothetical protein
VQTPDAFKAVFTEDLVQEILDSNANVYSVSAVGTVAVK